MYAFQYLLPYYLLNAKEKELHFSLLTMRRRLQLANLQQIQNMCKLHANFKLMNFIETVNLYSIYMRELLIFYRLY